MERQRGKFALRAHALGSAGIPKKDGLFIIGYWNAKVGSQETPGITGKFGVWSTE